MRFTTTVEAAGRTATGLPVPDEVVEALAAGKRPAVRVTIGGHTYRSTVAPRGGQFMIPLSAERRAAAGVAAGDTVDVDLELDTEPRTVEEPAELTAALDADPEARRRFDAMSYSHQLQHVLAVADAKTEGTRERRVAAVVAAMHAG
jgi:Domain of unknown function (DUF1905)/Bacteriocin-protection, YdeI or OmpD-Associated